MPRLAPGVPYTTLFRSRIVWESLAEHQRYTFPHDANLVHGVDEGLGLRVDQIALSVTDHRKYQSGAIRSEEHTSELQSPMYLVCRLLLEKKKKKTYSHM